MPFFNLRILFDFFWENDLKIKRGKERGPTFSKLRIRCFAIILSTALQFSVCFPYTNSLFFSMPYRTAKNLYISYSYTCFPGIFKLMYISLNPKLSLISIGYRMFIFVIRRADSLLISITYATRISSIFIA